MNNPNKNEKERGATDVASVVSGIDATASCVDDSVTSETMLEGVGEVIEKVGDGIADVLSGLAS